MFEQSPRPAPHPDRLRFRGASAAQGFPTDGLMSKCVMTTRKSAWSMNPSKLTQEYRGFDYSQPVGRDDDRPVARRRKSREAAALWRADKKQAMSAQAEIDLVEDTQTSYTINFGPQHPAAHGVLRLILEMEGRSCRTRRSAYRSCCTAAPKS
jgi:hypothetical protein